MKKHKKMVTYFNKKDLVGFGNYLLSDGRTDRISNHPETTHENIQERLASVSDADISNWMQSQD